MGLLGAFVRRRWIACRIRAWTDIKAGFAMYDSSLRILLPAIEEVTTP
jgi:hypothetical protein